MRAFILITVDGGVVEVVGATIECDVIIIDKDVGRSGIYEQRPITEQELDRLVKLEQSDFPSAEE